MFSRKLWIEAKTENISLIVSILFGVILGGLIVSQSWLLSTIISRVFQYNYSVIDIQPLLIGLVLVILGRGLAVFGRELSSGVVSIRLRAYLKSKLLSHLQGISPLILTSERAGELSTTLIQGVDRLDLYFRAYLPQLFISTLLPLLILWVVFPIDWISGIILLVTAPLIPLFMVLIGKQAEKETVRQWKLLQILGGHFLEVLQGLNTLKIFGLSKKQSEIIRNVSDRYALVTLKVLRIAFLSALTMEMLATISTAIIAVQIGIRLLYGQISFFQSLFILILAPDFYFPLRQLGAAYHSGMEGIQAAERIFEILNIPSMGSTGNVAQTRYNHISRSPDIQFNNVYYSYQNGDRVSLDGIELHISPNRITTLVGPTGSGKSTILSLLLKFISPDKGMITVSGTDLQAINSKDWRSQVAWVPQFPYLFNDTVMANLLIAKPSASTTEIITAAERAHLHSIVSNLPNGYDTYIGEGGSRLSGGQAQRIAIARALLKNSWLLLMDEPTKNLDLETEEIISDALEQLTSSKTVLIIAHRLSTIRKSDQIVVLNKGRVVQVGSPEKLETVGGLYKDLVYRVNQLP